MELVNNFFIEKFNPEVLREYDIRGIVEKDINQNTAYTIGRIFGHIVNTRFDEKSIVVGMPGRVRGEAQQKHFDLQEELAKLYSDKAKRYKNQGNLE